MRSVARSRKGARINARTFRTRIRNMTKSRIKMKARTMTRIESFVEL